MGSLLLGSDYKETNMEEKETLEGVVSGVVEEKVNIKKIHSIGKIVGTLVTMGGAMIMTVVVGPTVGLPWTKVSATAHQDQGATHAITLKSYPAELSLAALIRAAGTLQNGIVTVIAERGDTAAWRLHWDAGRVNMVYGSISDVDIVTTHKHNHVKNHIFLSFPPRCDGFMCRKHAALTANVMIEAFYDPVCLDSRDKWAPLKQAVDHYGPRVVSLVVHTFPLPVLGLIVIVAGLYLVIWGKSMDVNQSDTKGEGDQFPSANQQIPPTN
ncbi:eamA domain, WAT1-related protein [Artemisia annua]|uniref:EamA domain, WAT1-related protein n=1 Tax=Artemisia annua TaxID=35608 RepID=A0A2U1MS52_ARTAN|nr:eamA domain, WAT1-related protein [Artemisia annua]